MPATTDTTLQFDGQDEPNLLKFEIEYESEGHSIQTLGLQERQECLPGKQRIKIHLWVNGLSPLLDRLQQAQAGPAGFQVVVTVTYADDTKTILSYDDCWISQKTIKGEAQMPTMCYYLVTSTRERVT